MVQVLCPECGSRNSPQSPECWKCSAQRTDAWEIAPKTRMGTTARVLLITLAVIAIAVGICFAAVATSLGNMH